MARIKDKPEQQAVRSQEYVDDSSSEAESEQSSSSGPKQRGSKQNSKSTSEAETETSSSDESVSNESATRSASEQSAGAKRVPESSAVTQEPARKRSKSNHEKSQRVQPSAYIPPSGYDSVKLDAVSFASETEGMFSDANRKQVWHITAPASLPITSIKELDIHAALKGEPIIHVGGASYSMVGTPSKGEMLLLPKGSDSIYSKAKVEISQSFHLRETFHDQHNANGMSPMISSTNNDQHSDKSTSRSTGFFASEEGKKKAHREQPSGLLMRYQPFGTGRTSDRPQHLSKPEATEVDEDENVTRNGLVVPLALSDEEGRDEVKTIKKIKKSKRTHSNEPSQETSVHEKDRMDIDTAPNGHVPDTPRSKDKKSKTKHDSEKRRKKAHKETA